MEEKEIGVTGGMWGDMLNIPAKDAMMTLDGGLIDPPMTVEFLVYTLHELMLMHMEVMIKFGPDALDRHFEQDKQDEIRALAFQITAMLVALGHGQDGVTVESMTKDAMDLMNKNNGEEESEI